MEVLRLGVICMALLLPAELYGPKLTLPREIKESQSLEILKEIISRSKCLSVAVNYVKVLFQI